MTFPTQSQCFQESAQHRQGQALDQARLEGGRRGRGEVPEGDHGRGAQPDQALPRPARRQKQLERDQSRSLRVRGGKLLGIRANEKGSSVEINILMARLR